MPGDLLEKYSITAELGKGASGHVLAAHRTSDHHLVAIKAILRSTIPSNAWARDRELGVVPMEVFILKNVRHPNVIAYRDYYRDERFIYLITDRFGYRVSGASVSTTPAASPLVQPGKVDEQEPRMDGTGLPSPCHSPETSPTGVVGADVGGKGGLTRLAISGDGGGGSASDAPVSPVSLPSPSTALPPTRSARGIAGGGKGGVTRERGSSTSSEETAVSSPDLSNGAVESMGVNGRPVDLYEHIEKRGAGKDGMGEGEARWIFGQVASAVRYLHGRGVVHRDIKDENIIIDSTTLTVRLIDFGSATVEPASNPNHTHQHFQGTITYASPEILRGERYKGKASDVWALGVLLYTILFGGVPFGSSEHAIHWPFRVPPGVTGGEGAGKGVKGGALELIGWMLSKDPAKRPTMEEIVRHPWLNVRSVGSVGVVVGSTAAVPNSKSGPGGGGGRGQGGNGKILNEMDGRKAASSSTATTQQDTPVAANAVNVVNHEATRA
ncbi:hypothetical protein HDU97_003485 [Phlyctochytrium planicorne]|nr:hypothetical protein HDU97_003485 [Phlyctochytrium planicorne]